MGTPTPLKELNPSLQTEDNPELHDIYVQVQPYLDGMHPENKAILNNLIAANPQNKTNFISDFTAHAKNAATLYTQDNDIKNSGHGYGAALGNLGGAVVPVLGGTLAGGSVGSVVPGLGTAAGGTYGGITAAGVAGAAQDQQNQRLAGRKNTDWGQSFRAGTGAAILQSLPVAKTGPFMGRALKNIGTQVPAALGNDYAQNAFNQGTLTPKLNPHQMTTTVGNAAFSGTLGTLLHRPQAIAPPSAQNVRENIQGLKQYQNQLEQALKDPGISQANKQNIRAQHASVQNELLQQQDYYARNFQASRPYVIDQNTFNTVVGNVKALRDANQHDVANRYLNQFAPQTQRQVMDRVNQMSRQASSFRPAPQYTQGNARQVRYGQMAPPPVR